MRKTIRQAIFCAGLAAGMLWAPAAHAVFTYDEQANTFADSESGLVWMQTLDLSAAQASGFRLATTNEAVQLMLNSRFTPSGSTYKNELRANTSAPVNGLTAMSQQASYVYSEANLPVGMRLGMLAATPGENASVVLFANAYDKIAQESRVSEQGFAYTEYIRWQSWTASLKNPSSITGGDFGSGFSGPDMVAQFASGDWFTARMVNGTARPDVQIPYMMVFEVPETSTLMMMSLGLLAIGFSRSMKPKGFRASGLG